MVLYLKSVVQTAFNRAANTYESAAILGQEIAHRLVERLDYMRIQPKLILDVGAGTGFASQLLAKRYPEAQIYAVDFAQAMVQQGHSFCSQYRNIQWLVADAQQLPFPNNYFDLVFSNFMLPWCPHLPALFAEMQRVLTPSGLFLFSTLGPDTLQELRSSWAAVDEEAHVHLFLDLHDVGDALLQAQFLDPVMDREMLTMLYPEARQLFRELKAAGGQNLLSERRKSLTGKYHFQQFLQQYQSYQDAEGRCPATFEVIYGHAFGRAMNNLLQNNPHQEFSIPVSSLIRRPS